MTNTRGVKWGRGRSVAALAIILGVVTSGCGGGGKSTGTAVPPPAAPAPPAPPPSPPAVNRAPTVSIASPSTGNSFIVGTAVTFSGSADDAEDGAITGSRLVWSSSGGAELGTGGSLTLANLTLGTHTIRLEATDSAGLRSTTSVSIRITEPPRPAAARAGETNPYAGRIRRTAVKRDDELVIIGRASGGDQLVYGIVEEPVSQYNYVAAPAAMAAPRITARGPGLTVIAGAAGRIQSTNPHQAAIVTRSTAGNQVRLEVIELLNPGQSQVATLALPSTAAQGPFAVGVFDLDAFEEVSGTRAMTPPAGRNFRYHDEVAVAHAEMSGGELRARVRVLSFEDVMIPEFREGPVPGPTSELSALTTTAMHPESRLVVAHGDALFSNMPGPHLVVAYVDSNRRISLDVFRYRHTRGASGDADPRSDVRALEHTMHHALPQPLTEAAVAAGGWDLIVGRGEQFGMDTPLATFDVVMAVRQENGRMYQEAWRLESIHGDDGPPSRVGDDLFDFGSFRDAANVEVGLTILPDSPVRAQIGRVVQGGQPVTQSCESLGLIVLADTDRGPVVQSLFAFISDPFAGNLWFGPARQTPPWPGDLGLREREPTNNLSRAALVTGGLVSSRNGLVDYRGLGPIGESRYAQSCQNVSSSPLLGEMPSFYVAEPQLSTLSAVTIAYGGESYVNTGPLDADIDEIPVLLAADSNGDAAYYESTRCYQASSGTQKCRRLFLGDADLHYTLVNFETQNVVLQQPPKHVDFLRALGGIVDVSMRDNFYAEFAQTTSNDGSIDRRLKTDWMLGARIAVGWSAGVGGGDDGGGGAGNQGSGKASPGSVKAEQELSLEIEHRSSQENFTRTQTNVSLTQTTGAVDDDVVWTKVQSTDFWRFPASGGRVEGSATSPTALSRNAYLEVAIPGEPVISIGPGSASDAYQPTHQIGNILSYPAIAGETQDIGELFEFLGRYVPEEPDGSRPCRPLQDGDINGCITNVNGFLQQVARINAGEDFMAGELVSLSDPIDVAEELQVGGISYSSELQFDQQVQRGNTIKNTDTIKAGLKSKMQFKGKAKGVVDLEKSFETEIKAEASFENETISENTLGSKTKIALHVPSSIPIQRSYRIRPTFGFEPGGGLQVSYQVSTEGTAASFWRQNYSTPDAALNLPLRIVRNGDSFELNADFTRNRIKGFFVRDGAGMDPARPSQSVGSLLTAAPRAGDAVQLEVQVMNLSVASAIGSLTVEFEAQGYENGEPVGPVMPIGRTSIDFLPYRGQFEDAPNGHITSAFVIWDTSSFGATSSESLKDYLIYVTLDPDNAIANETHELNDRHDDPLRSPQDAVIDPQLEKGQNNRGWALVRVAPSLQVAQSASNKQNRRLVSKSMRRDPAVQLSLIGADPWGLSTSFHKTGTVPRLTVGEGESLRASVGLRAGGLSREHGILQVFDGDPALGAPMILSRAVQGVSGGDITREEIEWRPRHAGDRVLYVRYFDSEGRVTPALQVPVRIEPRR